MNISYWNNPDIGFGAKGQIYGKDPHWISISTKTSSLHILRSQNSVKWYNFNTFWATDFKHFNTNWHIPKHISQDLLNEKFCSKGIKRCSFYPCFRLHGSNCLHVVIYTMMKNVPQHPYKQQRGNLNWIYFFLAGQLPRTLHVRSHSREIWATCQG